ncbi:MAG: DoxX family protein [Rhodothermaceae bacterium]|nr:DoxX family protein [Rhodothermaceae bacterium]
MPSLSVSVILQVVVALGLLNVWLVRARSSTSYRGGDAQSLKEEFQAYGLPMWLFYVVGALKIGAAIALLVGLWVPALVRPAAGVVAVLMVGALAMHIKVSDPWMKALPAFLMLLMSGAIVLL